MLYRKRIVWASLFLSYYFLFVCVYLYIYIFILTAALSNISISLYYLAQLDASCIIVHYDKCTNYVKSTNLFIYQYGGMNLMQQNWVYIEHMRHIECNTIGACINGKKWTGRHKHFQENCNFFFILFLAYSLIPLPIPIPFRLNSIFLSFRSVVLVYISFLSM